MNSGKNLFQPRRWPVLAVAVVALLYAITNWLCVFSPSIQSYGIFLSWGFILPVLFSLGSWVFLFKQRHRCHRYLRWWIVGIIVTVGYVSMGYFTIFIFIMMCAAIIYILTVIKNPKAFIEMKAAAQS